MFRLITDADTLELTKEIQGVPKEECPVFTIRKLTAGQVNTIEDNLTAIVNNEGAERKVLFLSGTSRKLKIAFSLIKWKNVSLDGVKEAPCTDANKDRLPADIQLWLEEKINDFNGLNGIKREEIKN